jgi:hypothetical protein
MNRLGLWWGDSGLPTNVTGPMPPEYLVGNPYQAARWREAWRWRLALKAAEAVETKRSELMSSAMARPRAVPGAPTSDNSGLVGCARSRPDAPIAARNGAPRHDCPAAGP